MQEHEVAAVVQQARQRDPEALKALCSHFYPKVLKYMRYRVGPGFAGDLTGEVFVRMMRNIDRQSRSFAAWLYKIAAYVVADHFRDKAKRREVPMDETVQQTHHNGGSQATSLGSKFDLEASLPHLTDDQRQVVALKFGQGLSTHEAAEIMDRTPGAVRLLQFRALSTLRQVLDGSGGAP